MSAMKRIQELEVYLSIIETELKELIVTQPALIRSCAQICLDYSDLLKKGVLQLADAVKRS